MLGKDFFMQIYNYPGRVAVATESVWDAVVLADRTTMGERTCLWLKDLPLLEPTNIRYLVRVRHVKTSQR